jgi:opacity protein-like surface antigen
LQLGQRQHVDRAVCWRVPGAAYAPFRQNVNGCLGGGQIGYNWQLDRTWGLGLEGDIQWTGERSSMSLTAALWRLRGETVRRPPGLHDFAVPDLIFCADIKLNEGASLHLCRK